MKGRARAARSLPRLKVSVGVFHPAAVLWGCYCAAAVFDPMVVGRAGDNTPVAFGRGLDRSATRSVWKKERRQRDAGICFASLLFAHGRRLLLKMSFEEEPAHADAWEVTRKAKRNMSIVNMLHHHQEGKGRKRARLQDAWRRSALAGAVRKVVEFCLAPALRPQVDPSPPPLLEL